MTIFIIFKANTNVIHFSFLQFDQILLSSFIFQFFLKYLFLSLFLSLSLMQYVNVQQLSSESCSPQSSILTRCIMNIVSYAISPRIIDLFSRVHAPTHIYTHKNGSVCSYTFFVIKGNQTALKISHFQVINFIKVSEDTSVTILLR